MNETTKSAPFQYIGINKHALNTDFLITVVYSSSNVHNKMIRHTKINFLQENKLICLDR